MPNHLKKKEEQKKKKKKKETVRRCSPGASDDGSPVTPFEGVCIADAQLQSSRRPCIATHRTA